ncbi:hypothetical protein H6G41_14265 [Tolypothrix sp. FACHB-123]|uniref:hypothetical protein n=1 Tax=Tolypothrix sp. FACHB-123 TaxID=2692868 RepID=UPI00168966EC|nr:hypothetical protein [Tolypothrix sp. FACHB-123]MBD2355770.1 hypothetical protein [Tolypothrix sp. FACHB-123]
MIQNLLLNISELLQTELAGFIPQPTNHILALPLTDTTDESLPLIGIYPSSLEISQNIKESSSNQPQLQELHQEIIIDLQQTGLTYQLDKTPVRGFTLCHLIFDQEQVLLEEDTDFTIDYQQATITLKKDLSKASKILIDYSFMSILVIREFIQEFFIDILDARLTNIEKFSSLILGILLTSNDELIKNYNFHNPVTQYQTNKIVTTHLISQIRLINGNYINLFSPFKFQLRLKVIGQLKLSKTVRESVSPIQEIQISQNLNSSGRENPAPTDF